MGIENPEDSHFPELWIASIVEARNAGREAFQGEGLSYLDEPGAGAGVGVGASEATSLRALIESDPEFYLGEKHVKKHKTSLALLLKLLDSVDRLSIQVHPDKVKAEKYFHSPYGKTEAWYILGGRKINGEDPHVYFGFKPGVTREQWQVYFDTQNIQAMLDSLHKIYVKPGDVLFVEGGVPHAIGPGCFLAEIQEPTDYTLYTERTNASGQTIPEQTAHQGIGFEKMFDCFHYETYTLEEASEKWLSKPALQCENSDYSIHNLISDRQTDAFQLDRITIHRKWLHHKTLEFCVLFALEGQGTLRTQGGESHAITQGSQFFVPAHTEYFEILNSEAQPLTLLYCKVP